MKLPTYRNLASLVKGLAAVAVVASAVLAATSAKADDIPSTVSSNKFIAALRGGVYLNQNAHVRGQEGNIAGFGGLAYTLETKPFVDRLSIAVDYITTSKNGNTERLIPVMLEYQSYQGVQNHVRPYVIFGAGLMNAKIVDASKGVDGTGSIFAAMAGYGIDLASQMFVEARYTLVPELMTENTSGPSLMVGIRF